MGEYAIDEVTWIQGIYRILFPNTRGALADYWDYKRYRAWSLLTTDFHCTDLESILAFDVAVRQFETEARQSYSPSELIQSIDAQVNVAKRYRELAIVHNTGYSLCISPITDDLLLRTFSETPKNCRFAWGTTGIRIVTTAPDGRSLFLPIPPLHRYSILSEQSYKPAVWPYEGTGLRYCVSESVPGFPWDRGSTN